MSRKSFVAIGMWIALMGALAVPQFLYAQCVTPPSGMVAWWPLDETSDPTSNDIAGGANNSGTWMNSPVPVPGKVAGALNFNGSNYVDVPNHPELNFGTGDLSIDAWINPTNLSGIIPIVDKREDNAKAHGYVLFLGSGILAFELAVDSRENEMCGSTMDNDCRNYSSEVSIPINTWTHVAVTVDRDTSNGGLFYVNGVIVASFNPLTQAGNISNTGDLWIGRRHPLPVAPDQRYFYGSIDEVELFNRVLTPAEVQSIYQAGSAGKCKSASAIPALTAWGLIIFGIALLGFISWVFIRRRRVAPQR
jgi:hypothetical protein